MKKLRDKM